MHKGVEGEGGRQDAPQLRSRLCAVLSVAWDAVRTLPHLGGLGACFVLGPVGLLRFRGPSLSELRNVIKQAQAVRSEADEASGHLTGDCATTLVSQ
jgi:hypothetical protein